MKAVALILALCVVAAAAGPQPSFPLDWSSEEEATLVISQGPVAKVGHLLCCADTADCQIQIQHRAGNHYYDYSHNRTRWEDESGQVIVNNYAIQKEMLVVGQTCKEYCPMQGDRLRPGFIDRNATDKGPHTMPDGTKANWWQWKEVIFAVIVMETSNLYVDQRNMSNAVPLQEQDSITPFGQHLGDMTQTWKNFQAGIPDPSKFIVNGIDTCPMSQNCQQESLQMNRLSHGMMNTWLKYHQEANLAANELPAPTDF